jgi:hypothetical protein
MRMLLDDICLDAPRGRLFTPFLYIGFLSCGDLGLFSPGPSSPVLLLQPECTRAAAAGGRPSRRPDRNSVIGGLRPEQGCQGDGGDAMMKIQRRWRDDINPERGGRAGQTSLAFALAAVVDNFVASHGTQPFDHSAVSATFSRSVWLSALALDSGCESQPGPSQSRQHSIRLSSQTRSSTCSQRHKF